MSALPLNLIKGTRSAAYERLENTEDIEEVEQYIRRIKSKVWCFVCYKTFQNFPFIVFLLLPSSLWCDVWIAVIFTISDGQKLILFSILPKLGVLNFLFLSQMMDSFHGWRLVGQKYPV